MMISETMISVIIPVYNVDRYLCRCVDSVLAQTYKNLQVILVDDGSTDQSGVICDRYREKDSRIVVIHKANGGLSSARNAGIDAATGDYFTFVDSDDWIEPDAYENMLVSCKARQVQLVCAGRYDVNADTGERTLGLCPKQEVVISAQEMLQKILTWDGCDSSACDKLFNASLFHKIRFPDGRVSEDVAVMYRIVERAERVALLPQPIYNYYHRQGSISTAVNLSPKTFHAVEHAKQILVFVKERYPEIVESAKFFYVSELIYTLLLGETASKCQRKAYSSELCQYRRELWCKLVFVLSNRRIGTRKQLLSVLVCLRIYRISLKIVKAFKRLFMQKGKVAHEQ